MIAIALLSIGLVAAVMLVMALGQRLTGRCLRGSCGALQPGTRPDDAPSCDACPLRVARPSQTSNAPSS
ncbi:MAG: hypothetical protein AB7U83_09125 [Vicinamibacterales bacterium]